MYIIYSDCQEYKDVVAVLRDDDARHIGALVRSEHSSAARVVYIDDMDALTLCADDDAIVYALNYADIGRVDYEDQQRLLRYVYRVVQDWRDCEQNARGGITFRDPFINFEIYPVYSFHLYRDEDGAIMYDVDKFTAGITDDDIIDDMIEDAINAGPLFYSLGDSWGWVPEDVAWI